VFGQNQPSHACPSGDVNLGQVIEGKKRAKEEDALRREEERALRDSLAGGAPSGLPADLLVRPVHRSCKQQTVGLCFALELLLWREACPQAAAPVPQHAARGFKVFFYVAVCCVGSARCTGATRRTRRPWSSGTSSASRRRPTATACPATAPPRQFPLVFCAGHNLPELGALLRSYRLCNGFIWHCGAGGLPGLSPTHLTVTQSRQALVGFRVQTGAGGSADRKSVYHPVRQTQLACVQAEVRLADLAEERRGVQRAREAAETAHVAAVDAATIRGEVLGCDRADRHYWWFPGAPGSHKQGHVPAGGWPVSRIARRKSASVRTRLYLHAQLWLQSCSCS
jgi:hypothetical protein